MSWVCPSCGQEWPEKPLVDGTIGCPECGSIAASEWAGADVDKLAAALWCAGPVPREVIDETIRRLTRLSAAEQALREIATKGHTSHVCAQDGVCRCTLGIARAALAGREERQ